MSEKKRSQSSLGEFLSSKEKEKVSSEKLPKKTKKKVTKTRKGPKSIQDDKKLQKDEKSKVISQESEKKKDKSSFDEEQLPEGTSGKIGTPEELEAGLPYLFLGTSYDSGANKAGLRFYDPRQQRLLYVLDPTGHHPYCLAEPVDGESVADKTRIGVTEVQMITVQDRLRDFSHRKMAKIETKTPAHVPRVRSVVSNSWESRIPYFRNWIYDRKLVPGLSYTWTADSGFQLADFSGDSSTIAVPPNVNKVLSPYKDLYETYLPVFTTPLPELPIIAVDLEMGTDTVRVPSPSDPSDPIICAGLASSDDKRHALVLTRPDHPVGDRPPELPENLKVEFFEDEKELILEIFRLLSKYPIVTGFNTDGFDFPYLQARAKLLGIPDRDIPIHRHRATRNILEYNIDGAVHLDLYRWYENPSISGYAHGGRYKQNNLDAIAQGLLGERKVALDVPISDLPTWSLIYYCINDAILTQRLLTFDDALPLKIMLFLSRITRSSIDDLVRTRISNWIQNLMFSEHRRRKVLIPNSEDLQKKGTIASSEAIIKEKKYQGALVINPVPGVHFNVVVLDFASMYPTIIKERNLSYETINCGHDTCKGNKIPETPYYVCTQQKGIVSDIIGFIRDARVSWFKRVAKQDTPLRTFYQVADQALKVLVNASYGVLGAATFALYCLPVAESTTAYGRWAITETVEKAESIGMKVLYGDTDSVFLLNPTPEQVKEMIAWSEEVLQFPLDVDKVYRYIVLSKLKKNYFGVFDDPTGVTPGIVDIKGLTGKKSHTPPFIQEAFMEILTALAEVQSPDEFPKAREAVNRIVRRSYQRIRKREVSIDDMSISMTLTRPLERYRVRSQHVKAAEQLRDEKGVEIHAGDVISFVKTKSKDGVRASALASIEDIDDHAYRNLAKSTFEQVLNALDLEAEDGPQQINLGKFFGG